MIKVKKPELKPHTDFIASPKELLAYLKLGGEIKQVGTDRRFPDDKHPEYFLITPGLQWEVKVEPQFVEALELLQLITTRSCAGNYWISTASLGIPDVTEAEGAAADGASLAVS